jgi:septal ring factor EnvC (AmiA/AmiB activator)
MGAGFLIKAGIALAIMIAVGLPIYLHWKDDQRKDQLIAEQTSAIAVHQANEEQFRQTIKNNENRIQNLQIAMIESTAAREVADAKLEEAREQGQYMKNVFADHKFGKLLAAKPGLVTNLMQKKTQEVFDEFENVANSF